MSLISGARSGTTPIALEYAVPLVKQVPSYIFPGFLYEELALMTIYCPADK